MTADSSSLGFVFPGQGSQVVGMGRQCAETHPEAARVFAEADEALGFALSDLCWNGPEDELRLTANTQPAIHTVSIAIQRVLAAKGVEPCAVAGHSLGEYSALVAAGSLDFVDALLLVRRRGQLMQESVPVGVGAMAAILGLGDDELAAVVESAASEADGVCAVANLNAPGQTVIAGHKKAVERAADLAKAAGAKRALMLPVSAPFHSPLMGPVREQMQPYLGNTSFRTPLVPVVNNVDAEVATSGEAIRDGLLRQIDAPVRWVESVSKMVGSLGVGSFAEIGPGRVLSGLIRRIDRSVSTTSISDADGIAAFLGA